jgi:hypothetical protein
MEKRSDFQQDVVNALLDSKAINLELVGSVISKFGDSAARRGETLVTIIDRPAFWACGWPIDFDIGHQVPQLKQQG